MSEARLVRTDYDGTNGADGTVRHTMPSHYSLTHYTL